MTYASHIATALIALMRMPGIGRRRALKLIRPGDLKLDNLTFRDRLFDAAVEKNLNRTELRNAWQGAEEVVGKSLSAGIAVFSLHDECYPPRLRSIADPPAVVFVRGAIDGLSARHAVAIVGTRQPTSYGIAVAQRSGAAAARAGFAVVSGLALGCDRFAHEGCLEGGGIGVAILAHGLERIVPASNRSLADRLLEARGCLVSEYPLGTTPSRMAFAERDRIQSGLSDGVFVIETDTKGGTMNTVHFARKQGRELACVAHPDNLLGEEKTRGNQKLITDTWATAIRHGDDFHAFLEHIFHKPASSTAKPDNSAIVDDAQKSWSF